MRVINEKSYHKENLKGLLKFHNENCSKKPLKQIGAFIWKCDSCGLCFGMV